MHHLDETAHHLLASIEVCNDTITKGTDGADVRIGLFVHHLGFVTNGNHALCAAVKRYYTGLVNDYLTIADDDGVGRSQVHRYFFVKGKPVHI